MRGKVPALFKKDDMENSFKKCTAIMLPTEKSNKVGDIVMRPSDGRLAVINVLTIGDPQECINQHLYILSDEKIKVGDFFVNEQYFVSDKIEYAIWKHNGEIEPNSKPRKIIAATNLSLNLPRPSDSFIKKYCELGGIDKVMVEQVWYNYGGFDKPDNYNWNTKVTPDNNIVIK